MFVAAGDVWGFRKRDSQNVNVIGLAGLGFRGLGVCLRLT